MKDFLFLWSKFDLLHKLSHDKEVIRGVINYQDFDFRNIRFCGYRYYFRDLQSRFFFFNLFSLNLRFNALHLRLSCSFCTTATGYLHHDHFISSFDFFHNASCMRNHRSWSLNRLETKILRGCWIHIDQRAPGRSKFLGSVPSSLHGWGSQLNVWLWSREEKLIISLVLFHDNPIWLIR